MEDKIVHDFSVIEKDPEVSVGSRDHGRTEPLTRFVKASLLARQACGNLQQSAGGSLWNRASCHCEGEEREFLL